MGAGRKARLESDRHGRFFVQAALNCVIDSVELARGDDVLSLDIGY
jgi:hypothetical protein